MVDEVNHDILFKINSLLDFPWLITKKYQMYFSITQKSTVNDMVDFSEWVSVQDCIGLPGFPSGAPNVRRKLEQLVSNNPKLKRKKAKSKAYEYHVSVLPEETKKFLGVEEHSVIPDSALSSPSSTARDLWIMLFDNLTERQKQYVIKVFMQGGLNALMPMVADLEASADREIFEQRDPNEQIQAAPKLSTRNKAG
ncbi:hypothetical protein ABMV24_002391 [Escherichia coli]